MQLAKPSHNRYVLQNVSESVYTKYAASYSAAKRYGIRGIYAWTTGIGLFGVAREVAKGTVIQYSKQKLALVVTGIAAWVGAPSLAVLTNATSVVKTAKKVHSIVGFCAECVEDSSNLSFLPIDLAIFGQPIPVGENKRFILFGNSRDFLKD